MIVDNRVARVGCRQPVQRGLAISVRSTGATRECVRFQQPGVRFRACCGTF